MSKSVANLAPNAPLATKASSSSDTEVRQVGPEELKLHNKKKDCWIAIHGKVYDCSKFYGKHPGEGTNDEYIDSYAGTDATAVYDKFHFTDTPADWLRQSEIGAMPELKYIGLYNERSGSMVAGSNIRRQGWATVNDSPVWLFSVGERLYWATRQVPASLISLATFPDAAATSTFGLKYIAPAKCKVTRPASNTVNLIDSRMDRIIIIKIEDKTQLDAWYSDFASAK